jgi:Domain of unknown function (DUF4142)
MDVDARTASWAEATSASIPSSRPAISGSISSRRCVLWRSCTLPHPAMTGCRITLIGIGHSSGRHQAMLQQLSQFSGEQFDRQYMQGQVQDHQAAVALFSSEANQPTGPVDALAGELLPALQQHLEMAQEISDSMV